MIESLYAGVSGLQQFQGQLDAIGNNIANSNTIGYKSSRNDFADLFSQTQQYSSGNVQVGSGVTTSSVQTNFGTGTLAQTGRNTDLAINGNGFFVVKDPTSGAEYATQAGNFSVDANGYLVTDGGLRVQGFTDASLSTRGDIKIPDSNFTMDSSGSGVISEGGVVVGQVLLQSFISPETLQNAGNNLYTNLVAAGPLGGAGAAGAQAANTNGLGKIQGGTLEMSNVDLTSEFANLITAERGFQANSRVITTSDNVLQEVVNLKH